MATLTPDQADVLTWSIESGPGEVVLVPVGNAPEAVLAIPEVGQKRTARPTDFGELVAQGLLRHVRDQLYEVTNDGRIVHDELTHPPPEPPPVGFHPPSDESK